MSIQRKKTLNDDLSTISSLLDSQCDYTLFIVILTNDRYRKPTV